MQKIIDWIKQNPTFGFVGGLALLVALVLLFAKPDTPQNPARPANQFANQPILAIKPEPKPDPSEVSVLRNYKGLSILTNGIAFILPIKEPLDTISGKTIDEGFRVVAICEDGISPSKTESVVTIPIPDTVSDVSFTLSQETPDEPILTKYAYATLLSVIVDDQEVQTAEVSKQGLLTKDIKVSAKDANQITIKLKTKGYKEESSSEQDKYGPWFTFVVSNFQTKGGE